MINNSDLDPLRYDYPALVPIINALFFKAFFLPLSWLGYYVTHIHEVMRGTLTWNLSPNDYRRIYNDFILGNRYVHVIFWGRYVTALFSFGNVLLLYWFAKRLLNHNVALIAALLLAVNFRAVTNAHIGLPDTYNAFFLLLALIADTYFLENPTKKNYLLSGLTMGLSFSTKYQVFSGLPFVWNHLQASFVKSKIVWRKLFNPVLLLVILAIPIVFVILNPYFFIHYAQAIKAVTDVSSKYGMGREQILLFPYSYFYFHDYGPMECLMVLLGLLVMMRYQLRKLIFLLSVIVPFFVIMTWYSIGGFYVRNFITITPLVLIFAAFGIDWIYEFLKRYVVNKPLLISIWLLLIGLTIALPLKNVLIHDYYYTKPWVYDDILTKTEPIFPDNAIIASHPFHTISKVHPFKRIDFEMASSYSLSEFKEQGAQYALVNMDLAGNAFYNWMIQPLSQAITYWQKPVSLMNDSFWAASIEEMMQYVQASSYKPWQAPDAAMFFVKIPDFETGVNYHPLKSYTFDVDAEGWQIQNGFDGEALHYSFDDQQGHDQPGSLMSTAGVSMMGTKRISSPAIPIQQGHTYRISGFMKSDQPVEVNKRNAFMRAEFLPGGFGGVSARYEGEGWKKYVFIVKAPLNTREMRLSFQIADSATHNFWLDDIAIEESDQPVSVSDSHPVPFDEYRDLLFPNSHGNL